MSTSAILNAKFKCGNFFNFMDNPKWHCTTEDPQDIYDSMSDRQKLQFVQYYVKTYRPPDCYWGMVYVLQNSDTGVGTKDWAVIAPYPLDDAATMSNRFEPNKCNRARFIVLDVTIVYINLTEAPTQEWISKNWRDIDRKYSTGLHATALFVETQARKWEYFDPSGGLQSARDYSRLKAVTRTLKEALQLKNLAEDGVRVCPNIQGKTNDSFCAMWSMFFLMFRLTCPSGKFVDLIRLFPQAEQLNALLRHWMCFVRAFLVEHRLWTFSFEPTLTPRR